MFARLSAREYGERAGRYRVQRARARGKLNCLRGREVRIAGCCCSEARIIFGCDYERLAVDPSRKAFVRGVVEESG